jgi:phosphoribosylformylglycinamidine synthase subunit PurQ / glutaminase
VCKNVYIKAESVETFVGKNVNGKVLQIPVAHGEGRYFADAATMEQLNKNNQIVFRYCDEQGEVHINSNPNGATANIAGICNEGRNVFGMMPHPERACSAGLSNIDGRAILEAFTLMN